MPRINDRIIDLLVNGSPAVRRGLCEAEPMYFAIYYFPEYFDYEIPPFHYDLYQDIKDLTSGALKEAMWCCFRDSAKTSIAKIAFVCWLIAYKKKKYINWDSFDGDNSEAALFDVTVALQTNTRLIADFGHLYFMKNAKEAQSEAKMKRVKSFITENDVRVQAFTTQESTRGRLYKNQRPDCYIFDDFETTKTKDSYPATKKIKDHIDELRSGLPANACVLYLCNYITEEGSVAYLMEKIKANSRCQLRFVSVYDRNNDDVIAWPDKFVVTDAEADHLNRTIDDSRKWKISLESRRKSLGPSTFEAELMNNPAHSGDKVFDRDIVEDMLKAARKPIKTIAGFKQWFEFNPSHRYAGGADTAKGVGKDSNASAFIDFTTKPARVVATYKNNLIAPDIFAYELVRQANIYGQPLLAPEANNTGYATLTQLKKLYPLTKIYVPLKDEKVRNVNGDEYGFWTDSSTKPEMIFQLKRAIEDGLLVVFDEDLLNELKYYSQKDLTTFKLVDGMTRHYDLLIALAIAWAMRSFAKVSDQTRRPFQQGAAPLTEYQG